MTSENKAVSTKRNLNKNKSTQNNILPNTNLLGIKITKETYKIIPYFGRKKQILSRTKLLGENELMHIFESDIYNKILTKESKIAKDNFTLRKARSDSVLKKRDSSPKMKSKQEQVNYGRPLMQVNHSKSINMVPKYLASKNKDAQSILKSNQYKLKTYSKSSCICNEINMAKDTSNNIETDTNNISVKPKKISKVNTLSKSWNNSSKYLSKCFCTLNIFKHGVNRKTKDIDSTHNEDNIDDAINKIHKRKYLRNKESKKDTNLNLLISKQSQSNKAHLCNCIKYQKTNIFNIFRKSKKSVIKRGSDSVKTNLKSKSQGTFDNTKMVNKNNSEQIILLDFLPKLNYGYNVNNMELLNKKNNHNEDTTNKINPIKKCFCTLDLNKRSKIGNNKLNGSSTFQNTKLNIIKSVSQQYKPAQNEISKNTRSLKLNNIGNSFYSVYPTNKKIKNKKIFNSQPNVQTLKNTMNKEIQNKSIIKPNIMIKAKYDKSCLCNIDKYNYAEVSKTSNKSIGINERNTKKIKRSSYRIQKFTSQNHCSKNKLHNAGGDDNVYRYTEPEHVIHLNICDQPQQKHLKLNTSNNFIELKSSIALNIKFSNNKDFIDKNADSNKHLFKIKSTKNIKPQNTILKQCLCPFKWKNKCINKKGQVHITTYFPITCLPCFCTYVLKRSEYKKCPKEVKYYTLTPHLNKFAKLQRTDGERLFKTISLPILNNIVNNFPQHKKTNSLNVLCNLKNKTILFQQPTNSNAFTKQLKCLQQFHLESVNCYFFHTKNNLRVNQMRKCLCDNRSTLDVKNTNTSTPIPVDSFSVNNNKRPSVDIFVNASPGNKHSHYNTKKKRIKRKPAKNKMKTTKYNRMKKFKSLNDLETKPNFMNNSSNCLAPNISLNIEIFNTVNLNNSNTNPNLNETCSSSKQLVRRFGDINLRTFGDVDYQCEPYTCDPGKCNPLKCDKMIQARRMKLLNKKSDIMFHEKGFIEKIKTYIKKITKAFSIPRKKNTLNETNKNKYVDALDPYQCEPNTCKPYECDPIKCHKLIQTRLLKQNVNSNAMVPLNSPCVCLLDIRTKGVTYSNRASMTKNKQLEKKCYCTLQFLDNNNKCNCHKKVQVNLQKYLQKENAPVVSQIKHNKIPRREIINDLKCCRSLIKIESQFSLSVEIFKKECIPVNETISKFSQKATEANICEPHTCTPGKCRSTQCDLLWKAKNKQQRQKHLKHAGTKPKKYSYSRNTMTPQLRVRNQAEQFELEIPEEPVYDHEENLNLDCDVKRTLCKITSKFSINVEIHKNIQPVSNNLGFNENSNYRNKKKLKHATKHRSLQIKPINKPNSYECEPYLCVPGKCDTTECYNRVSTTVRSGKSRGNNYQINTKNKEIQPYYESGKYNLNQTNNDSKFSLNKCFCTLKLHKLQNTNFDNRYNKNSNRDQKFKNKQKCICNFILYDNTFKELANTIDLSKYYQPSIIAEEKLKTNHFTRIQTFLVYNVTICLKKTKSKAVGSKTKTCSKCVQKPCSDMCKAPCQNCFTSFSIQNKKNKKGNNMEEGRQHLHYAKNKQNNKDLFFEGPCCKMYNNRGEIICYSCNKKSQNQMSNMCIHGKQNNLNKHIDNKSSAAYNKHKTKNDIDKYIITENCPKSKIKGTGKIKINNKYCDNSNNIHENTCNNKDVLNKKVEKCLLKCIGSKNQKSISSLLSYICDKSFNHQIVKRKENKNKGISLKTKSRNTDYVNKEKYLENDMISNMQSGDADTYKKLQICENTDKLNKKCFCSECCAKRPNKHNFQIGDNKIVNEDPVWLNIDNSAFYKCPCKKCIEVSKLESRYSDNNKYYNYWWQKCFCSNRKSPEGIQETHLINSDNNEKMLGLSPKNKFKKNGIKIMLRNYILKQNNNNENKDLQSLPRKKELLELILDSNKLSIQNKEEVLKKFSIMPKTKTGDILKIKVDPCSMTILNKEELLDNIAAINTSKQDVCRPCIYDNIDKIIEDEKNKPRKPRCTCKSKPCKREVKKKYNDMKKHHKHKIKLPCVCGSTICKAESEKKSKFSNIRGNYNFEEKYQINNQGGANENQNEIGQDKVKEQEMKIKSKAVTKQKLMEDKLNKKMRRKKLKQLKKVGYEPRISRKRVKSISKYFLKGDYEEVTNIIRRGIAGRPENKAEKKMRLRKERKLASKKLQLKKVKATVKRFQKHDSARKKKRIRRQILALKEADKYKNAGDALLIAESALDIVKLGGRQIGNLGRLTCRSITHPSATAYYLKNKIRSPGQVFNDLTASVVAPEGDCKSTFKRINRRLKATKLFGIPIKCMESIPGVNYIIHICDKNPKKRMKKVKLKKRKKIKDPVGHFNCSLLLASLRFRRFLWLYKLAPWFYPHCISFIMLLKQLRNMFLFTLAVIVWTPCIIFMELCRAVMCCFFCGGG